MTAHEPPLGLISTIVIDDMTYWKTQKRDIPDINGIGFHSAEDMFLGLVDIRNVEIILSPLIAQGRDALEIARCLQNKGFRGKYRVIAEKLLSAKLIIDDIREEAPDVDFDILEI